VTHRLPAAIVLALLPAFASAADLPSKLDLHAPFPVVTLQAPEIERVAPGVEYGDYELWSDAGPISVHVIAADLTNPGVHARTVLAGDALGSNGETISDMAQRTGAVAGINGDYFDIGRTNRPTNIVVQDGTLLRSPRKRYALALLRSGSAHFAEFSFTGSVQIGTQAFSLDGVDVMPSHSNEIALLTPAFGAVSQEPGFTSVALTPTTGTPPFAAYRVDSFAQTADGPQPAGYYLVVGSDVAPGALPAVGDAVVASGALAPIALSEIADAVGGGPLILYHGAWYADPDGPRGGAFDHRIPCSGAALESDGTLLLVEVDGRQPERSVGLTRPQLAELMRALGAQDGMAFDGGGSSAIAVRLLGERKALLQSSPSDGIERRVANGIFLYNDAPVGAAQRLVASPQVVRAVPGAQVALHVAAIDADEHPADLQAPLTATVEPGALGTVRGDTFVAAAPGTGRIQLRAGTIRGSIPLEVAAAPARLLILPPDPNVEPHGVLALQAHAFDAAGFALALPRQMLWSASGATIDGLGQVTAGDRDADVRLDVGGRVAALHVSVGSHDVAVDIANGIAFLTFPAGGSGSASAQVACDGCIRLTYAIGDREHAAYAVAERELPAGSVGLSFDVRDDGSGAALRLALRNAIDEQVLLAAVTLNQQGLRHVVVRFPLGMPQPMRLVGFYVIATRASPAPAGSIVIGNVRALVGGSR